jgi:23S rRNA (cytidine1920-2'-O)/16S rRNA (cytidine1409-2'-O)-methyltransferase
VYISKKVAKKRLDILVAERELADSREKATREIIAGNVLVNEEVVTKPGAPVPLAAEIRLKEKFPYVSRGALKLIHALDRFKIDPKGKVAVDIGSSTGGFTEVLLERGAEFVFAVDCGTNQLDWKIRNNPRVLAMENTNARFIDTIHFSRTPEFAVMDVSFISVTKILPPLLKILADDFLIVTLIKPQFELKREFIARGGFVKPEYRQAAIDSIVEFAKSLGLVASEAIESPITGAKSKNIEYLITFRKG